jgi:23S rRNA (cytidine1920-2'-O)/16S rRNA (cytidine1409-2'-O)-methyltransferase
MADKQRLDILLHERGLAPTREKARGMIMAGEVLVNGQPVDKPGTRVGVEVEIVLKGKPRFVSRGGEKLARALEVFALNVPGCICADVGASTGGFTDCLLQNGAARVYAIDVGYGQLDYTLRQDPRVVVIERTNARYLDKLGEPVNLVVMDASFISLKLLLPVVRGWLTGQADVIPLIKPQFEAGKQDIGKGGVVRDPRIHKRVLEEVLKSAREQGFAIKGLTASPIKGPAGNTEFLAWLGWGQRESLDIPSLIHSVLA